MDLAKSPLLWDRSVEARQVRLARDAMHSGKEPDPGGVRPVILDSWRRCRAAGVNPSTEAGPIVLSADEAKRLQAQNALTAAAMPILRLLTDALRDHSFLLLLADDHCRPIEVLGTAGVLRECERINVVIGSEWTEQRVGTDAVALSSLLGEPVQVHWYEHYAAVGDRWTGNAAPIREPSGRVAGTVSIYGYGSIAHPRALELAIDAAAMIEQRLLQLEQARRLHLLERFQSHLVRFPTHAALCLSARGAVVALSAPAVDVLGVTPGEAEGRVLSELPGLRLTGPAPSAAELDSTGAVELRRGDDRLRAAVVPIRSGSEVSGFILELEGRGRERRRPAPDREWRAAHGFTDIVGESAGLLEMLASARTAATRDCPVLIVGESGTGKELVAHAIHAASARASGPFVPLNCGGLGDDLLSSELFGYEDGAFTGAARGGRIGKLELADGGTLFLDEVEAMSPRLQVHLLRFLEEKRVLRVGGSRPRPVDVRILAATNVDLRDSRHRHRFRRDLYYRLEVFPLRVPPLRERRGDVGELARHLLALEKLGKSLSPRALEALQARDWPGNVRELRNVLVQAALRSPGERIDVGDLPFAAAASAGAPLPPPPSPSLAGAERHALLEAIHACEGNLSRAAAALAIHRVTLHRKLKRHGIRVRRGYG